jgi:L-threonylcarbamoyladenylate synthase
LALIGKNIDIAKKALENAGLVAIPTETVYGLAANALDTHAVLKIFEAKDRPFFDPLIVHVGSLIQVANYAVLSDERLIKLANCFWPGPLTLLLPKKANVPDIVTSGLDRVAIRIPNHSLTLELLGQISYPVAAPSANPFGYVSPTEPDHVNKQLGEKVDYILDGGKCNVGIESTIVGIEDGDVCIYRLGGLSVEDIESCVGTVSLRINLSSNPKAPGQLKNHYAPSKPLFIGNIEDLHQKNGEKKIAAIVFGNHPTKLKDLTYFNLSKKGDLSEAAVNLFTTLRLIDEGDFDLIIAELLPDSGLGRAVNDRLRRAEVKI